MSKLLLDEHPLLVLRELACKIGLNESMILQQIHYWNAHNSKTGNNYRDGHYWTFNSVVNWQDQFPFWSTSTIKRTIKRLEDMQLVITGNYNKLKIDRTKWYRIDYDNLDKLDNYPLGQCDPTKISDWINQQTNLNQPLPEINTETKSENNIKRYIITKNGNEVLSYYEYKYNETLGREHPEVTEEQLQTMEEFIDYMDIKEREYDEWIDEYFEQLPESNNGSVLAFMGDQLAIERWLR